MSAATTNRSAGPGRQSTVAEGSLLDQAIAATKQTEPDRAQDLIKTLTEEALKGTLTWSKDVTRTFNAGHRGHRRRHCPSSWRRSCTTPSSRSWKAPGAA